MVIHISSRIIENSHKYFIYFSLRTAPVIEYNEHIVKKAFLDRHPSEIFPYVQPEIYNKGVELYEVYH